MRLRPEAQGGGARRGDGGIGEAELAEAAESRVLQREAVGAAESRGFAEVDEGFGEASGAQVRADRVGGEALGDTVSNV